ncbi:filament-like plant protein [Dorcoceras hygrometricum]|uniref:Filament-like plant protein n=1 Tax=Dorcoceras hygrometricum TaxID=472368 RepID=A0A2Z7DED7_9LAMI|nr:filament-like plant protein [Dorcoceras hygrometricum]
MVITKDVFVEAFGLPTEGMVSFINLSAQTVVEMRMRFSGTDVPFRAPNKKKEVKVEYRLLHDIVAMALCAKVAGDQDGFNPGPILDIPTGDDNASAAADQEEHVEYTDKMEIEAVDKEQYIVVRSDPKHTAQQLVTSSGKIVHALVQIKEINWVTHFLPKIDPAAKGKELLQYLDRPTP